jgi:hypothetical protein
MAICQLPINARIDELTEQYPSDLPSSTFLAIFESGFETLRAFAGVSELETSPRTVMTNEGSMLFAA